MKRFLIILTSAVLLLASASCSSDKNADDNNGGDIIETLGDSAAASVEQFDYMANDLTGMIKLGDYKNISVTKASPILTEEEFENEIDALLDNYSYYEKITDRAVEEGDTVVCDYSGYLDGVQFSGGTAQNTELTAAPNSGYIEGFAEAFIGQTPGEEFSFDVTFPAEYDNADLAGKEVTFVCTVHSIYGDEYITPELTDDFVNENFGYSNVDEFKIAYRTSVEEQKKYYVESTM
ncbi:MAG: FKBP-type peptidyl-prolyl cis-trans isomerase, partial [Eubacteriales bacterium]